MSHHGRRKYTNLSRCSEYPIPSHRVRAKRNRITFHINVFLNSATLSPKEFDTSDVHTHTRARARSPFPWNFISVIYILFKKQIWFAERVNLNVIIYNKKKGERINFKRTRKWSFEESTVFELLYVVETRFKTRTSTAINLRSFQTVKLLPLQS